MSLVALNRQIPLAAVREAATAVYAAAMSGCAGTGKVVAIVSGGNLDLSHFAMRVGAGDNDA